MRRGTHGLGIKLLCGICLAVALSACAGNIESSETTTTANPVREPVTLTVNLLGNRFDTEEVSVPRGSTIIFHNTTSADHGLVSSEFDIDLRPGQDYPHTFNNSGSYEVRSRTHTSAPDIYLRVIVE